MLFYLQLYQIKKYIQSHKQKIKNIQSTITSITPVLQEFTKTSIDASNFKAPQLELFKDTNSDELNKYISKIQEIKTTLAEIYSVSPKEQFGMDIGQYQDYAKALEQLTPAQAALTLSTQDLTNEQIMNTLALKTNADTHEKLTVAEQYQALADAGLLVSCISLTKLWSYIIQKSDFPTLAQKSYFVTLAQK